MDVEALQRLLVDWDVVFRALRYITPILLFVLGIAFLISKRSTSSEQERQSERALQGSPQEGIAEPPAPSFDTSRPQTKSSERLWSFLGQLAIVIAIVDFAFINIGQFVPSASQSAQVKGPETDRFFRHIENAEKVLGDDNLDAAKSDYLAALSIKGIPMEDAAEAIDGVAKVLRFEESLDAAKLMASIAAGLHTNRPDFVNTYAEILIEDCDISLARDKLQGLGLDKDNKSHDLMELAEIKSEQCNNQ